MAIVAWWTRCQFILRLCCPFQIIKLLEIVRNSQRIVGASVPFLSQEDAAYSYFNQDDATQLEISDHLGPPVR